MVNILFLTPNRKNHVGIDFFWHWEQALGKIANCKWAGFGYKGFKRIGESIDDIIFRLYGDDCPDWVIATPLGVTRDMGKWKCFSASKDRHYKMAAVISDIHASIVLRGGPPQIVNYFNNQAGFDVVFMMLKYCASKFPSDYVWRNLKPKKYFLPYCLNPDIYKPNDKTVFDITFLGRVSKSIYPLRRYICLELEKIGRENGWNVCLRKKRDRRSRRPFSILLKRGMIVGKKYVEVVGQSKIFIFTSSVYKYPVLKYVEGMACRTCVMADMPLAGEELHLVPDENFVEINRRNWKEKVKYYLSHNEERERIANEGYKTFLKYHTCDIRAKETVDILEKIS